MTQNNSNTKDTALRTALQREGRQIIAPIGMTERVMEHVRKEAKERTNASGQTNVRRAPNLRRPLWWGVLATAAAVLVAVFVLVQPRIKDSREMTLYEGSYVEKDGQRVEDYELIKGDIHEALSMADKAEAYLKE